MFNNEGHSSYKITIPLFTSKEVIDWFEDMAKQGTLSEELVSLVNEKVKAGNSCRKEGLISSKIGIDTKIESNLSSTKSHALNVQNNLIDGLYNWQEAAGALFTQEAKEEKVKKKMLQV